MSPFLALGLLVAGFCPAVLCHPGGTPVRETSTQGDQYNGTQMNNISLVSSNTDFAFSLYKQLASENPNKNVIFSPLSISTALAFLSLGAHNTTLKEILEGLKFNLTEISEAEIHQGFQQLLRTLNQPGDHLQLNMGNAMFVQEQQELQAKFRKDAQALYAAQAFLTNFQEPAAAEKFINDYVKKETQGKIVDLIKGLDTQTVMVLVNYIFFKAKWKMPFDPRDTFKSKFHLSKSQSVKVPMMSIEDLTTPFFRDEELSCTVVELKYTGNASALFILPDQGKMQEVETNLLPETLSKWKDSLQSRRIDELYLPKFSISSDYDLEYILPQLGIKEVFTRQADLSGLMQDGKLMVSQVVHKAVIDVTEVGTEAAAATGVKVILTSAKLNPVTVNINRPFLLIISDTQNILFLGKVTNPKQV
ncbi:alpha-1-antichymotrypsin [Castor canadensis]|uniref:Alpha-1-antichymotrypsin n=1 Tax=Castor canadensis TaxID=51338 RepID=A0A8B7W9V4_CASCN